MSSSIPVIIEELLNAGENFVYAYYDGIDKIAHERGFGAFYDAELRVVDALISDIISRLPSDTALYVTADHGQAYDAYGSVDVEFFNSLPENGMRPPLSNSCNFKNDKH